MRIGLFSYQILPLKRQSPLPSPVNEGGFEEKGKLGARLFNRPIVCQNSNWYLPGGEKLDTPRKFNPAAYAYHNCEFREAIEFCKSAPPSVESAIYLIKSLCELADYELAVNTAEQHCEIFPNQGVLHYLRGMSYYHASYDIDTIEAAFTQSRDIGFDGGKLGLGFIAASRNSLDEALRLVNSANLKDSEWEHIKHLMRFQVYVARTDLIDAEHALQAADRTLSRFPSFLRNQWGRLCWARLLRANGQFEGARVVIVRLLDQIDKEKMPRLHYNATCAKKHIDSKDDSNRHIIFPASRDVPSTITKKPMLNSLYKYLAEQGRKGADKEEIVKNVWEEAYNPLVHDDRIYKAVGRLRKLLGDDFQAPKKLIQEGRNYILNTVTAPTTQTSEENDYAIS